MSYAALPILRTPRLTLRPLEKSDADAIVEGVGNYDVSKWLSVVPYPYTREDALWFIDQIAEEAMQVWGICEQGGLIGVGGFDPEFGYWIARKVWRRGYGFEAAHAMVTCWFDDPQAPELVSGYFEGNEQSGAVLRALGFVKIGFKARHAKALSQEVRAADMRLSRERWKARQKFELRTPRLWLRPIRDEDASAFAAMTVPEVARNLGRIPVGMSEAEAQADLDRRRWRGLPNFTMAIVKGGQFVGTLGFGGDPLSIGYFLDPGEWGKGLMTEALSAFLPEIFERFPVNRIVADHFEDNPASGAVLRKVGFRETGRDMGQSKARLEPAPLITYALTRDSLKVAI